MLFKLRSLRYFAMATLANYYRGHQHPGRRRSEGTPGRGEAEKDTQRSLREPEGLSWGGNRPGAKGDTVGQTP